MGYTHYHGQKGDCSPEAWNRICADFQKIAAEKEVAEVICRESDRPEDPPEIELCGEIALRKAFLGVDDDGGIIYFNGKGDDGHETMVVPRKNPGHFQFCKTARKPYDLAVCALLLIMESHAPGVWSIGSDGSWEEEWVPARNLYERVFGKKPPLPRFAQEELEALAEQKFEAQ